MTNEYQTMIEYIKDTTENKEALDAVAPRKKEAVKNRFFFRFSTLFNPHDSARGVCDCNKAPSATKYIIY